MFDSVKILGIKISKLNKKESLELVSNFLVLQGQYKIFTPNPEMLVDARKDSYFRKVLNNSDLNICDGHGIKFLSKEKITVISGVDFMLDICKIAEQEKYSIFLLGSGSDIVLEKLQKKLQNSFPKLKIVGSNPGLKIDLKLEEDKVSLDFDKSKNEEIIKNINESNASILFVAFGHNKQEKWIYENLQNLPKVKLAMGVGGSFDFISGKIKRAPKFLQRFGLEWFYRLIIQPKRFMRILKATIIFTYFKITNNK
ncbi:MAG: hypothetical protein AUJ23_01710 [Candidatus Magasanikbacteria bacterium CG1_02_32_51]|uniref:Glycosyltransferase n=1 Tax=Candidatus Magasanikbacteria bacterium CG1_02_32_51 TaxID=1805238 RepID=A0A1J4U9Z8_9BACT|nr:MAG: hypothetical protein AUJ23_01710 [Candidatus Magasanikbacteria bacterium CG1_02_32_51]